jgi:capsular polysaccharide biosynthesis protein
MSVPLRRPPDPPVAVPERRRPLPPAADASAPSDDERQLVDTGIPWRVVAASVVVVVLAAGTAYLIGSRGPDRYGADVELVYQVGSVSDSSEAERVLTTQVVVIEGPAVLGPVAERAGRELDDLEDDVSASVVRGSQIIRVRVVDEDPERARALAQDVADTYAEQPQRETVDPARDFLQGEIDTIAADRKELRDDLAALQARPAADRDATEEQAATNQLQVLAQQEANLSAELVRLELDDLQAGSARVLAPARALDGRVEPTPERSAALGGVAGLIVAAGMVALAVGVRRRREEG